MRVLWHPKINQVRLFSLSFPPFAAASLPLSSSRPLPLFFFFFLLFPPPRSFLSLSYRPPLSFLDLLTFRYRLSLPPLDPSLPRLARRVIALSQILTGSADGSIHVLYSPSTATKGITLAVARAPKARQLEDSFGAGPADREGGPIIAPHSLPMFKDDGPVSAGGRGGKRRRERERHDPQKTMKPSESSSPSPPRLSLELLPFFLLFRRRRRRRRRR